MEVGGPRCRPVVAHESAGAGGLGIARQIRAGLLQLGLDDTAIRERIAVLDSRGLIVSDNEMRDAYKSELAWSQEQASRIGLGNAAQRSLTDVVDHFKPTVLIGASGQPGSFPEALIRRVAALVERPIMAARATRNILVPVANAVASAAVPPLPYGTC